MAKYKVKIDRELCIGAASCSAMAPNTFELDSEGKAVIKKKDGSTTSNFVNSKDIKDTAEDILNAAKSCPSNAIIVIEVDEKGNEIKQIWPA